MRRREGDRRQDVVLPSSSLHVWARDGKRGRETDRESSMSVREDNTCMCDSGLDSFPCLWLAVSWQWFSVSHLGVILL